jgi:hypothetical protein|tara:strand:+ start:183 stop:383 length:201 start_codon:yes stop_codon:yes gene_type:complete
MPEHISSVSDLSDEEIKKIMTGIVGMAGLDDPMESQVVANTGRCIVSPEPTLYSDIKKRYRELMDK